MNQESEQYTDVITAESQALSAREQVISFLRNRGIDVTKLPKNALVPCSKDGTSYIQFLYGAEHSKYRSLEDKSNMFIEGGSLPWYMQDNIDLFPDMPLLITEGELDALAAYTAGHYRVISAPNGANVSRDDLYETIFDKINDDEDIIIASDNDKDGEKMLSELSRRLGRSRCKKINYEAGQKDLNDILQTHNEAYLKDIINHSSYVHIPGIYKMSDLRDEPPKKLYDSHIPGLSKLKLRRGDFSVVTGIPGNGKTTFMNALGCEFVTNHGWKIAYASFEQSPTTDHKLNLRQWYCQAKPEYVKPEKLDEADQWIDENFIFFVQDEDEDVSFEWIIDMINVAVRRYGVDWVILDPWNEIDHRRTKHESQTEYVGAAIRALKRVAKKLDCHVTVVAHPSKMTPNKDGSLRIPTLYDISDSQHWNNKCDIGIIIHRDLETKNSIIRLEKCRYADQVGELGNREDFFLRLNTTMKRYSESGPT